MHPSSEFTTVGDIFSASVNKDRKKPFDIRTVMRSVVDQVVRTASAEAGMWAAKAHPPPASGVASNLASPCRLMSAAAVAMSPTPVILSVLRDW